MDARKEELRKGLNQLNNEQLQRVIDYKGEMLLDDCNYKDGLFCPLAIGLQLEKYITEPTDEKVVEWLTRLGFSIYNTRGIEGSFYTDNRRRDFLIVANEILNARQV